MSNGHTAPRETLRVTERTTAADRALEGTCDDCGVFLGCACDLPPREDTAAVDALVMAHVAEAPDHALLSLPRWVAEHTGLAQSEVAQSIRRMAQR